jgi:ketosteroid isomerase-like protein
MSQAQPIDFKSAIQKAVAGFEAAATNKNASQMASFYSADATLLPPGSPAIQGQGNIQGFWQGFLDAGAAEPKIQTLSVESSGDLAFEIGTYSAIMPNPQTGVPGPSSGKYLVVWKRQSDGTIKMVADMFSPNA